MTNALVFGQNLNQSLYEFIINHNNFTGKLPVFLGYFSNLSIFWVNDNQFTGTIPNEYGYLSNIISLTFDYNKLIGSINIISSLIILHLYIIYDH